MIEKQLFGKTGHLSSRVIFGAAALGAMSQDRAESTFEVLDKFGINHIDVAASYGDAELRLGPILESRRSDFFLATKTGLRTKNEAKDQLKRSLERMQVDNVDLIQLHNLTKQNEWNVAMGSDGALEGLIEAKKEGLVKNIGVTGHGTFAASMHLQSLQTYDFDSVLLPHNFSMMSQEQYKSDFEELYSLARSKEVAIQTIKSIALRRWTEEDEEKRYSWYRPITDKHPLKRAVDCTLSVDGLFLNSSSDATLLEVLLSAAAEPVIEPSDEQMQDDYRELKMEPLFVRGVSDDV